MSEMHPGRKGRKDSKADGKPGNGHGNDTAPGQLKKPRPRLEPRVGPAQAITIEATNATVSG